MLHIGNRREVFWDDHLLAPEMTTAVHRLCHPVKEGICHVFENGLENSSISYPNILRTETGYRMYYLCCDATAPIVRGNLCVCESTDGLHWHSPDLKLHPYPEAEAQGAPNNLVVPGLEDGLFVFYDPNPACPPQEKYKAIGLVFVRDEQGNELDRQLWCYCSADGYRFGEPRFLTADGRFDSLNTLMYVDGTYRCYVRNIHPCRDAAHMPPDGITRDIRLLVSKDFRTWAPAEELTYADGLELQMYTNNIMPYPRAPHILFGLPTRYYERCGWSANDSQFASAQTKRDRLKLYEWVGEREAVALTDALFMLSRDGKHFYRYAEPFLTPGPETAENWLYGDCYFAYGMTDADEHHYRLYMLERHGLPGGKPLASYRIRKDGFACIAAGHEPKTAVTKPLLFTRQELHLNFSTSAYGSIVVEVLEEDGTPIPGAVSFEIYGDTTDRRVTLADGETFQRFAGRPVRLRFRMCEAELYAMWFA